MNELLPPVVYPEPQHSLPFPVLEGQLVWLTEDSNNIVPVWYDESTRQYTMHSIKRYSGEVYEAIVPFPSVHITEGLLVFPSSKGFIVRDDTGTEDFIELRDTLSSLSARNGLVCATAANKVFIYSVYKKKLISRRIPTPRSYPVGSVDTPKGVVITDQNIAVFRLGYVYFYNHRGSVQSELNLSLASSYVRANMSQTGNRLVVSLGHSVVCIDTNNISILWSKTFTGFALSLALAPVRELVAVGLNSGVTLVLDLDTGSGIYSLIPKARQWLYPVDSEVEFIGFTDVEHKVLVSSIPLNSYKPLIESFAVPYG